MIEGYSRYKYNDGIVFDTKTSKNKNINVKSSGDQFYKLKNDKGDWKSVSLSKLKSLCGEVLNMCDTAKEIPNHENYYIDHSGRVYSFSRSNPNGMKMKVNIGTNGYPRIKIKDKTIDIHNLMAQTFIMEDYVKKGFVCMHKDNDKTNCNLSNLSVGTYSQNNKDAYATGVNKGNGLKKDS